LIDQLASDRIRGGRLILAYAVGIVFGAAVAISVLLATAG
jgi:hypothetical protein